MRSRTKAFAHFNRAITVGIGNRFRMKRLQFGFFWPNLE